MKSKEQFINETFDSINHIQRVEANPLLVEKIIHTFESAGIRTMTVQPRILWQMAACIAVLVVFNIFTWTRFTVSKRNTVQPNYSESIQTLAENYFN